MNDELTTQLSRELHQQVDGWTSAPLTLEGVRGRAHSIRRTRRAAAAGVAALAVAAIAVPTALLGPGAERSDRSSQIADNPTEATAPTPRADGTFPLTLDVPEGPVPSTGYIAVDDGQLVTPDGTSDLPGDFVQVAPYDDGWVGIRAGSESPTGYQVVVLDADFDEVSADPSGPGLVTSSDGLRVAWTLAEGNGDDWTVVNARTGGGTPTTTPTSPDTQVEGFLTDDRVVTSHFDEATGETFFGQAAADGEYDAVALDGYQRVGGVSEPAWLVAGQTEFNGDSTCSEVRRTDTARGQVAYETCDHQLGAFSPDGRLLIGFASYYDLGSPTLAILDAATGEPVVEWTSSRAQEDAAIVHSAAWEDADTVVAVVEQGGVQQVLRLETDGSVTRTGEPREAAMSVEYFLPQDISGQ